MKRILFPVLTLIIPILLIVGCNNSGSTTEPAAEASTKPVFDLAAAKTSIETVNAEFGSLVAKNDSAGIANLYTSDAKLLGANMPAVSGKANIQTAFSTMLSMGIAGAKLTTTEVWGTESLVSEEGVYSLSDKTGKEIDKGKYIVLWKMEEGKWKLFRDCWNSDNPPAPAGK